MCKDGFAKSKCEICGKDLCDECSNESNHIYFNSVLEEFSLCDDCEEIVEDNFDTENMKVKEKREFLAPFLEELKKIDLKQVFNKQVMLIKMKEQK